MTIYDVKIEFQKKLAILYEPKEIQHLFEMIGYDLGYPAFSLVLERDKELSSSQLEYVENVLCRLQQSEPIQYIRGKADFYGLQFNVNKSVLIPRQETEELVDLILRENNICEGKIIDLGTGSGCIAISLAKNIKNVNVSAIDISPKALQIAIQNAKENDVNISFKQCDMCSENLVSQLGHFDIIVSNPPYVCNSEKSTMKHNVLNYEPHTALFVDDNLPLKFYESIANFAAESLTDGGKVYCEINESFGQETLHLFETFGLKNVEIIKDISGKDRIIKAQKL